MKELIEGMAKLGVSYRCNICKIDSWQSKPIELRVYSPEGSDNPLTKSLRYLCPNCYSQIREELEELYRKNNSDD